MGFQTEVKTDIIYSHVERFGRLCTISWEKKSLIKQNKIKYQNLLIDSPIAINNAPTFAAVFADVSIWMMSLSAEYCCASSVCTFLLFSISALFPANAMTTWGSPLLWSSFTQDFAPLKESWIESRTVQLVGYNVTDRKSVVWERV